MIGVKRFKHDNFGNLTKDTRHIVVSKVLSLLRHYLVFKFPLNVNDKGA